MRSVAQTPAITAGIASRRLAGEREVLEAIALGWPLPEVLEILAAEVEVQAAGMRVSVLRHEPRDGTLRFAAGPSLSRAFADAVDGLPVAEGAGTCGHAAYTKRMVADEDVLAEPRWLGYHDAAVQEGVRACWCLPLLDAERELLGTFALYYGSPARPAPAHLALIQAAAGLATIALQGDRDRRDLRENLLASRRLAAEQTALHRVSAAVARNAPPEQVFAAVAREAARLLDGDSGAVLRYLAGNDRELEVSGIWTRGPAPFAVGARIGMVPGGVGATVRTGRSATAVREPDDPEWPAGRRIACPVRVAGEVWGVLVVSFTDGEPPAKAMSDLERFAGLAALAVDNAATRQRLAHMALTDPLTGLANHGAFQQRLRGEVAHAKRHGGNVALALIDLDHFKAVNDQRGHQAGDALLQRVARELQRAVRQGELLARVGGDEFALVLPGAGVREAVAAAERARSRLAARRWGIGLSAGVCDLEHAGDADELLRRADDALYAAKNSGRSAVETWSTALEPEDSGRRAQLRRRNHALAGIGALARAVDAKDGTTWRHSERVAELAQALALAVGWDADEAAKLGEAGRIHDVGKIGVPDRVLLKPGGLDDEERAMMQEHAVLGARIVADVLAPEQAAWIRHHHERPDGRGYPDGLAADQIPAGARLLAVADAWDAMTSDRPYRSRRPKAEALAECRRLAGAQFDETAVTALVELVERGAA